MGKIKLFVSSFQVKPIKKVFKRYNPKDTSDFDVQKPPTN